MKEHEALEDRMITRVIEKSQRKVEAHNFDIRKQLLEFDDTANDQRKAVYKYRNRLLDADHISEIIANTRHDVVNHIVTSFVKPHSVDEQWDIAGLEQKLQTDFGFQFDLKHWLESKQETSADDVRNHVVDEVDRFFREKETTYGSEIMRAAEKYFLLQVLDQHWKEHLASMDYLRQGIYLRGYAQKQPKQEYKNEAFAMWEAMLARVDEEVIQRLAQMRIRTENEVAELEAEQRREQERRALEFKHAEAAALAQAAADQSGAMPMGDVPPPLQAQVVRDQPKIGRNDACPCGSGKKYKQCHGRLA
jgi:preprotein translocase subunit SecA